MQGVAVAAFSLNRTRYLPYAKYDDIIVRLCCTSPPALRLWRAANLKLRIERLTLRLVIVLVLVLVVVIVFVVVVVVVVVYEAIANFVINILSFAGFPDLR